MPSILSENSILPRAASQALMNGEDRGSVPCAHSLEQWNASPGGKGGRGGEAVSRTSREVSSNSPAAQGARARVTLSSASHL